MRAKKIWMGCAGGLVLAASAIFATAFAMPAAAWPFPAPHDSHKCDGTDTRICFFKKNNYRGITDSFRCDQAGKQEFTYIWHEASSVRNNCRAGSSFMLFSEKEKGKGPRQMLRIEGQQSIPQIQYTSFKGDNAYIVRIPDGATTVSSDTPNDGHSCRGADTRICFFGDQYFTGAEKSFKCGDGGTKKLGDLAQQVSSVVNNCAKGSAFRVDGTPAAGGPPRSFTVEGQSEYGWLGYHQFNDTAQTVERLR